MLQDQHESSKSQRSGHLSLLGMHAAESQGPNFKGKAPEHPLIAGAIKFHPAVWGRSPDVPATFLVMWQRARKVVGHGV